MGSSAGHCSRHPVARTRANMGHSARTTRSRHASVRQPGAVSHCARRLARNAACSRPRSDDFNSESRHGPDQRSPGNSDIAASADRSTARRRSIAAARDRRAARSCSGNSSTEWSHRSPGALWRRSRSTGSCWRSSVCCSAARTEFMDAGPKRSDRRSSGLSGSPRLRSECGSGSGLPNGVSGESQFRPCCSRQRRNGSTSTDANSAYYAAALG